MYTTEIDFQTETEHIQLSHGKFADALEAATFAIGFVKPYVEKCKIAHGEWRVYNTASPEIIERHCPIESLLSLRAKEAVNRL